MTNARANVARARSLHTAANANKSRIERKKMRQKSCFVARPSRLGRTPALKMTIRRPQRVSCLVCARERARARDGGSPMDGGAEQFATPCAHARDYNRRRATNGFNKILAEFTYSY